MIKYPSSKTTKSSAWNIFAKICGYTSVSNICKNNFIGAKNAESVKHPIKPFRMDH